MSQSKADLTVLLEEEVKGLTSYLDSDDYSNALDDASRETGWDFPVSEGFRALWMKVRAKRYLFFYLLTESAHKFKIKQISLNHRFEHYYDIIYGKKGDGVTGLDADWEKAKEEYPAEFIPVGTDPSELFGTKVDAGFQYQPQTGIDTTYTDDNKVCFSPSEED